jgi:hypothetical protein
MTPAMAINALNAGRTGRLPAPSEFVGARRFDDFRESSRELAGKSPDELREAATKLVSTALVLPVLSSLHESPLRAQRGPFALNSAEKRFGPLLDEHLADRITRSANFTLIDTIVKRFAWADHRTEGPVNVSA